MPANLRPSQPTFVQFHHLSSTLANSHPCCPPDPSSAELSGGRRRADHWFRDRQIQGQLPGDNCEPFPEEPAPGSSQRRLQGGAPIEGIGGNRIGSELQMGKERRPRGADRGQPPAWMPLPRHDLKPHRAKYIPTDPQDSAPLHIHGYHDVAVTAGPGAHLGTTLSYRTVGRPSRTADHVTGLHRSFTQLESHVCGPRGRSVPRSDGLVHIAPVGNGPVELIPGSQPRLAHDP